MPRKAKEEVQDDAAITEDDAPITAKVGDVVSTVAGKAGEAASTVAEAGSKPVAAVAEAVSGPASTVAGAVGGTISAAGEKVGGVIASVTGGDEDKQGEEVEEGEETVPENEALPEVVSVKGEARPIVALPEYLKGRRIEMGRVVSDKMQKTVVVL